MGEAMTLATKSTGTVEEGRPLTRIEALKKRAEVVPSEVSSATQTKTPQEQQVQPSGHSVKENGATASSRKRTPASSKRERSTTSKTKKPAAKKQGEKNAELGRRGEDAAARFLERRGYEIVNRNWTCNAGEADIVARDESTVVFVEVKTRSSCEKGFPSEAVTSKKRARYEKIAAYYLSHYEVDDVAVRFDIVSLVQIGANRALIRHHINAFGSDS